MTNIRLFKSFQKKWEPTLSQQIDRSTIGAQKHKDKLRKILTK